MPQSLKKEFQEMNKYLEFFWQIITNSRLLPTKLSLPVNCQSQIDDLKKYAQPYKL